MAQSALAFTPRSVRWTGMNHAKTLRILWTCSLAGWLGGAVARQAAGDGFARPPIDSAQVADYFANQLDRQADPKSAESDDVDPQDRIFNDAVEKQELRRLIEQLGGDSFALRERASFALAELPAERLETIQSMLQPTTDPEIRTRVDSVLQRRREQAEAKLRARFLTGASLSLPGWDGYRGLLGDGVRLREMFLQIRARHPAVLESIDADPATRNAAIRQVAATIAVRRQAGEAPDEADTIAILLLAGDPAVPLSPVDEGNIMSLMRWSGASGLREDTQLIDPFHTLVGAWIRRCGPIQLPNAFFLAMQWDLTDGLEQARQLIAAPLAARSSPESVSIAHQVLTRFGDRSDVEALRGNLDDPRPSSEPGFSGGELVIVQVGDTAAAAITLLLGKPLSAIGLPDVAAHPAVGFNLNDLGFADDEARLASREQLQSVIEGTAP